MRIPSQTTRIASHFVANRLQSDHLRTASRARREQKRDGTFQVPLAFPVGPDDGPLAVGDLDGDGWLDLAAGNQESASVTALRNRRSW
jgi:hypothetical protein